MRRRALWALALLAAAAAACPTSLAPRPVARLEITPGAIPQDDGYATVVTLDATGSRDGDGDGGAELSVTWSFDDDAVRFEPDSDAHTPVARVRFAGRVPPRVTLTVRARDGREDVATARVALTAR